MSEDVTKTSRGNEPFPISGPFYDKDAESNVQHFCCRRSRSWRNLPHIDKSPFFWEGELVTNLKHIFFLKKKTDKGTRKLNFWENHWKAPKNWLLKVHTMKSFRARDQLVTKKTGIRDENCVPKVTCTISVSVKKR